MTALAERLENDTAYARRQDCMRDVLGDDETAWATARRRCGGTARRCDGARARATARRIVGLCDGEGDGEDDCVGEGLKAWTTVRRRCGELAARPCVTVRGSLRRRLGETACTRAR